MIPKSSKDAYDLYTIHRKTNFSIQDLEHIGSFSEGDYEGLNVFNIPTPVRRQNFHGAIIRAVGAVRTFLINILLIGSKSVHLTFYGY